jgi:hypothetical protein
MTVIASYPLLRTGARQRSWRATRTVEKPRPRAHFDGEYDKRRDPHCWICAPCEPHEACQSGTGEDASFWDGPPLTSKFAAQVLGQAMPERPAKTSAGAAYRKTGLVLLPLFDKEV